MTETAEADKERREREFAEYDASVSGSVEPDADKLAALVAELKAAVTYSYDSGSDGYQQSADAMWKAAVAAFNWAASEVGATGFQASWAALRTYGETMHIDCPFIIVRLEDALYPQYDLPGRLTEFIEENRGWLAEQASAKLAAQSDDFPAHPRVVKHWRKLASTFTATHASNDEVTS